MSTRPRTLSARPAAALAALFGGAAMLMSACGGGGDEPPIERATFAVAAGVSAYLLNPHQYDLKGSLDGVEFSLNYRYTPEGPATFEGQPATAALQSMTISALGSSEQSSERAYFRTSPYRPYGSIDLGDGTYSVYESWTDLPATARVGDTGPLGTERVYADASKAQWLDTATVTWSLEADTSTTALFCINVVTAAPPPVAGSECYRVDATGQVFGMVVKVQVLGKTLVLG